jgi:TetR/AcrR family transcriptional regulator, transcriptional repressor for nem operon
MRESGTRELLIQQGLKSFLTYGYDGVGIGPVLAAVNVPKGSFYHFFRSKEDFAVAVLEAYVARYASLRIALQTDGARPPLSRLRSHFDALEEQLIADYPAGGCLYGVLSQTIAALGPTMRERLKESFQRWQQSIRHVLEQAQDGGELDPAINAEEAAAFLIDAYEGALIRTKSDGVTAAFRRFRTFALEPLIGQVPRAPASIHGRTSRGPNRKTDRSPKRKRVIGKRAR